jgi:hypothetical protein
MTKKIIFNIPTRHNPESKYIKDIPQPASKFMPEWWKNSKIDRSESSAINSLVSNLTFKSCVPFLDSLTTGYMVSTHQDIFVEDSKHDPNLPFFTWNVGPEPMIVRPSTQDLPVPAGHYDVHCAWKFLYGMQLPKGYSALFTHPLNRFDLPFTTVSGIIDRGVMWSGKFTFWLKKDFRGLIPAGTPFIQIIPFKNENWKSEKDEDVEDVAGQMSHDSERVFSGYYKKNIHYRKSYK